MKSKIFQTDSSGTLIELDFKGGRKRKFKSNLLDTNKTLSFKDADNAEKFIYFFKATGNKSIKMDALVLMSDIRYENNIWTPDETGYYKMTGHINGINWFVDISPSIYK